MPLHEVSSRLTTLFVFLRTYPPDLSSLFPSLFLDPFCFLYKLIAYPHICTVSHSMRLDLSNFKLSYIGRDKKLNEPFKTNSFVRFLASHCD